MLDVLIVLQNWDNSPYDDMEDATKLGNNEDNKVGDVVVYGTDINGNGKLDSGEIDHSSTVIEVDKNGNTTYVRSKEGQGPITNHHPRQQNENYGEFTEYYRK